MLKRTITVCAVLLTTAAAACSSDSSTNPATASIAGLYNVTTVNGSQIPYTVQSGTDSQTLLSDQIIVADGGTWSETYVVRQTISGTTTTQTFPDGGSWSRTGVNVTFTSTGQAGPTYTGTFTGSALNLTDGSLNYVFARQ